MSRATLPNLPRPRWRVLATGLLLLLAAGCVSSRAFRDGQEAEKRERWDLAVLAFQKAVDLDPGNLEARTSYERARLKAAGVHYERGRVHRQSGQMDLAAIEL